MTHSKETVNSGHSTHIGASPAPKVPVATFAVDESDGEQNVTFRLVIITLAVAGAYFATIIHVVGTGFLAHSIVAAIGGADKVAWLTIVVTIHPILLGPPVAQAADLWGRKWLVVAALMAGTIGCIIVSRSNSIGMAIAGQAIAGFNQTAQALAHAITSEILPRKYRPWAQTAINVGACLGGLVALYVGGALCRDNPEGFRNYWYLSAAVFFVVAAILAIFYKPPTRELQYLSARDKIRRFDLPGVFLLIIALLGICLGLGWSQNPFGWGNAHILVPFLLGVAGVVCIIAYFTWFRKDGLIHHGLFRKGSRNYVLALICIFCEGLSFFAANNYFGYQVGLIFDRDLLLTGATYSITWITYGIATLMAGWYCSRTQTLKLPVTIAFVFFVVFFGTMVSVGLSSGTHVWGYGVFLGIGLGVSLNALVVIAQLSIPPELIATGTSLMIAVRASGGTVGLAVYNAVFNAAVSAHLGPNISKAALSHGLPPSSLPQLIGALASQDFAAVQRVPGINYEIIQVSVVALKEAFNLGFRNVYITATAFGVVALGASLFLKDVKDEFTRSIDAPLLHEKAKLVDED